MLDFQFFMPSRLVFGPGKLAELATTEHLPGKKALIVIGAGGAMVKNGYLERTQGYLAQRGVQSLVYDKILPNPLSGRVDEAAALARKERCDFVLGLGGGSTMDAAKGIALMAANDGVYWDYMPGGTGGGRDVKNPALPMVAIPTTAGTGSESDSWAVISKSDGTEKIDWGHDSLYPVLSIIDPELMLSVPPRQTAYTGMDALFHAVEGYLSTSRQPISDHLSLEAVRLIAANLPKAVKNGADLEARTNLAWASCEAGICESLAGCISHHSMEHAVSAFYPEVAHGAGLVMLSRAYFAHVARRNPERFMELARALGQDVDVDALPDAEHPMPFVHGLDKLIKECGLGDECLSKYGVRKEDIPAMAQNALDTNEGGFQITPCNMTVQDVIDIYNEAYA